MHELKNYRVVMCNDTEEWWKTWRGIKLSFQNWHKEFDNFWLEHSKVSKIWTLRDCFWLKYIMFELKKYKEVIFHDTGQWCKIWRKINMWFRKRHEEFGKFSQEQLKVSMKYNATYEEKTTCQFKIDMRNLINFDSSTWKSKKFAL